MEKEMEIAGFTYNWKKMETAAQDRARWRRVVCGLCSAGSDGLKETKKERCCDPVARSEQNA